MAGNNLKTIITADTAQFKKGVKDAQNALKDFSKQGESALSSIEGMFGGTSGTISTLANNIRNATNLLTGMASEGGRAISSLERSTIALRGALAGLGITAAVAAFRELNSMADRFRQTVEGTNLELQAQAYRDTFQQAMEDQLGRGRGLQSTKNSFKNALTEVGGTVGNIIISTVDAGIKGITSGSSMGSTLANQLFGGRAVLEAASKSMSAGSDAAQYQGELNRVLDERVKKTVEWQRLTREIAENERIAADSSLSQAERQTAVSEAIRLHNELSGQQLSFAKDIAKWTTLISAAADNSKEETKEEAMAMAEIDRIGGDYEIKLRSLQRLQNRITNGSKEHTSSAKETQQATELTLEAASKLVEQQRALNALQTHNNAMMGRAREASLGWNRISDPTLMLRALGANQAVIKVPAAIVPKVDTDAAKAAVVELSDIIENGVVGMSEALGGLIGDLINGENAWGNFAQAGISVVADMLSTVGKAFIAEGVGVIAAKKALTMGAGAGAVAAGAAMVALAATMKTAMSNAASSWGSGGYSSSVASSSYASSSAYGASAFGREMEVKVTGTLTANGSKLVAVLNNENDRRSYTT